LQISAIITAVGAIWDTSIIAKPTMADGKTNYQVAANTNYILFYDMGRPMNAADPSSLEEQMQKVKCQMFGTSLANLMLIAKALRKAMLSITITNGYCYTDEIAEPEESSTENVTDMAFTIHQLLALGDAF
jgi:hypothetical protein